MVVTAFQARKLQKVNSLLQQVKRTKSLILNSKQSLIKVQSKRKNAKTNLSTPLIKEHKSELSIAGSIS